MNLIHLINKSLQTSKTRFRKKKSYFDISDAGKTPYEIFKKLNGKASYTPRQIRIFDNGNDVHNRIRKYLSKQGVIKAEEVRIKNRLFHGRADAILFKNGETAVLEIKSKNLKGYERMRKFCDRNTYWQLQLYMHFLKIDKGIIIVECKNDQRLKQFNIRRKPRTARYLINYFSKLKKKFVQEGVMAA
jgi:hypothetical protein